MGSKTSFGPFGGDSGNPWDDGVYTTVRRIIISVGDIINTIRIEYDKNGESILSPIHGGNIGGGESILSRTHGESVGGGKHVVDLDYPYEFLISISGYYAQHLNYGICIQSLSFQTNRRKTYGSFGKEIGDPFFVPFDVGKIIGFYGRSGLFLNSIGVHVGPVGPIYISVGPFGGDGGNPWNDGVYTTVRRIIISAGEIIDSICVEYDKNGESVLSSKSVGSEKHVVELDYPDEFLVSISGYCGLYMDFGILIQSLTFQTNRKTYGPFGREIGDKFFVPSTIGKIIGFYGRSGEFLDSIGAYIAPIYRSVGPFGNPSNNCWDDGVYTTVRQLIIKYNILLLSNDEIEIGNDIIPMNIIITSICIEYDHNGQSVWSPKHGEESRYANQDGTQVIKLCYPDEFLISFSGYCRHDFLLPIVSLTFQTNYGTYGPFGKEMGQHFSVPSNIGKIVGFNGSCSGDSLCAIGAHLEKFSHP